MKAAGCSCRVRTRPMRERRSDSTKSRFSSPGTPKIRSTPSFSSAATSRSDPLVMFPSLGDVLSFDRADLRPLAGPLAVEETRQLQPGIVLEFLGQQIRRQALVADRP